jgi:2-methylisocitrate lyase-like PEP mutase family enzyme
MSAADRLRALHVPGDPVVLPNAWDASSARAIEAAGFPAVATTSGGVAAALGYEDHEGAPAREMFAAAGRIAGAVEIPTSVDAEAGYGMEPAELVAALKDAGAAGCNLEDTDNAGGSLRETDQQADWLRRVREAADDADHGLVINARIDVFIAPFRAGTHDGRQGELVGEALARARAYVEAGADCVYPILLWEADALRSFTAEAPGPVNALGVPSAPTPAELAEIGVARITYGGGLHHKLMAQFSELLETLRR